MQHEIGRTRVLVVEDEAKVADALVEWLIGEGYAVCLSRTEENAFYRLNTSQFDIILLDWYLPGRDGMQLLNTLRMQGLKTPILFLTARDSVEDRIAGLNSGADDYMVKPFAFPELSARIDALLRRSRSGKVVRLRFDNLEMDLITRRVIRGDRIVELTLREFQLLEYLLQHENEIVTRDMLACDVWNEPNRGTPIGNVIDVHIARLRKKVDSESNRKLIHTIRGIGFMLGNAETG